MGSGGKSVPFENPGDTVTGTVLAPPEKRQQTDMDDGKPKTIEDGTPMFGFVVRLQTDLRDPEDPFDNGERTLFLKWKSLEAVRAAIKAVGAPGLQVGGRLSLRLTGFGQRKKVGHNPPKLWAAQYVPPDPNQVFMAERSQPAGQSDGWGQPAGPAQQPAGQPMSAAGIADMQRLHAQQQANATRLRNTPDVNLQGQPQPDQPPW